MDQSGIIRILRYLPANGNDRWEAIIEFIKSGDINSYSLKTISAIMHSDKEKMLDTVKTEEKPDFPKGRVQLESHTPEKNPVHLCGFSKAWVGKCKERVAFPDDVCHAHSKIKCGCGKQAVKDCEATIGAFVCGRPTCATCKGCNH